MRIAALLAPLALGLVSLCNADSFTYTYTQNLPGFSYVNATPAPQPQFVWTVTTAQPVPISPEPGGTGSFAIPFTTSGVVVNDDAKTDLWSPAIPQIELGMDGSVQYASFISKAISPWIDPATGQQHTGSIIADNNYVPCSVTGDVTTCLSQSPAGYLAVEHEQGHFDPPAAWAPDELTITHNADTSPVPEPASYALIALGGLGLLGLRRSVQLVVKRH